MGQSNRGNNRKKFSPTIYIIAALFILCCIVCAIIVNCSAANLKSENEQLEAQMQVLEDEVLDQAAQIEQNANK